jgi:hypothetical protein
MTATIETREVRTEAPSLKKSWLLLVAGILALSVGLGSVAGGVFGVWFTWNQAVVQDVTTPGDATIPETPVRGPLTMWSQIDIINHHQLANTDGLYFAQMPRLIPQLDEAGQPVIGENGEPVMIPNAARGSWFNATTLTTALSLGIISYALAAMAMAVGLVLVFTGLVFLHIRKHAILV